jgi:mono/diheme cytochrome c family protein
MRMLGCLLMAAACGSQPSPVVLPLAQTSAPSIASVVARGEYVAALAGCATCHGADLAGGALHRVDGGTWRAPNITPDRATGVGGWTVPGIARTIREGVMPDGERLRPIMPYVQYQAMTDSDVDALVAYLLSRPAVHHQLAHGTLAINPVIVPLPLSNVDRIGDARAHGEYLAALMHCAACHGPGYRGGMTFQAEGETVTAPNITSDLDHGIGTWTQDDIVAAVRTMTTPRGRALRLPMAAYRPMWAKLTDDDARALAVYIHSIPAASSPNEAADATL